MTCPVVFRAFLAEVTEAFETRSDPAALWATWIDVVVERAQPPERWPEGLSISTLKSLDDLLVNLPRSVDKSEDRMDRT